VTPLPKRRWYQFSLRTLLAAMLVASCGLGWLGNELRIARNRERAIAECDRVEVYVYQYQPTALGKTLRCWPALDGWVRAHLGDSLLSHPLKVSTVTIREDQLPFLVPRLKLFPSLQTIRIIYADDKTVAKLQETFPTVDVQLGL